MGKRDYAIISLAKTTGLRGSDIISLKLNDIDWKSGVISVTKRRAGIKIQLPLLFETGEAIKDYILNGRPQTDSEKNILSTMHPINTLKRV